MDMKFRKTLSLMCFLAIMGCSEDDNSMHSVNVRPIPGAAPALHVECPTCSNNAFYVTEGEPKGTTFLVSLKSEPKSDVKIVATVDDEDEIKVSPLQSAISVSNWKETKVSFEVTGVADSFLDEDDMPVSITFKAVSDDPDYAQLKPITISGFVIDSEKSDEAPSDKCTQSSCKDATTLNVCDTKTGKVTEKTCEFGCSNAKCNEKPAEKCTQSSCKDATTLNECNTETGVITEKKCEFGCHKNACLTEATDFVPIRFMAANLTSGSHQNYDDQRGIRIIQAFKPDIILMQEFNYENGEEALVEEICGADCHYATSSHSIPNAIVSKFPIIDHGSWESNIGSSRNWDWAVIDLPGDRDLLAVSVHLHGDRNSSEMGPLRKKIEEKLKEANYYVVVGGDFNTKSRGVVRSSFSSLLHIGEDNPNPREDKDAVPELEKVCDGGEFPVDQNGNSCTSGERDDPYDWVLFDKELNEFEVPVVVGERSYRYGHIVDSRIYEQHDELSLVPPIQAEDSELCYESPWCGGGASRTNMQHQGVVRDIRLPIR